MKELPPIQTSPQVTRIEYAESPRLRRIRALTRLLDQSIVLPNGYRIGLDPLIGLLPVVGDLIATLLSFYNVYEAARLGMSKRILLRMSGNILLEALIGEIPILGDIFDAMWKANVRNLRLIELHYRPTQPERSGREIASWIALVLSIVVFSILAVAAGMIWFVWSLFN